MRQLPPLNSIKGFEAVVRLGNYNNAAAELGVTHGAVSRQVRVLEEFFGCKLFQTNGRQLVPTELARYYATECSGALDRIAQATSRLREPAAARLVRVSGTPSMTMHWLVPRLGEFQKRHPAVEVSLAASREPIDQLVTSNDIILRRTPLQRDGFECRALFRDRRVLVCTPELVERAGLKDPSDVLDQTLLIGDGRRQAGVWDDWIRARGLNMPKSAKRMKFDHVFVLIEAVLKGLGLALLSHELMEQHLRSGRLVEPFPGLDLPYPNLYALYPSGNRGSVSVRAFLRWLIQEGEKISGPFAQADPFDAEFDRRELALR
ncbi:LysR family transcriptional regulator [Pseudooceanicola sp. 216_PA32_1]|jgi:LysR family transcriptional regulator, glycine cleavage system transcriptional activator|uniref:LysR family transcriptional regulator n=1 Tax=Pseudooceanicola pacificus TaxID=2676438 RepID=A0A844W896_9RHOB|nr:LysR substrate-binding domain-containing protein [Pseudooceanicola pacificus]MWB79365.1 LysR family transcriptional regulator [Pseudooceanicola pacificus]